MSRTLFPVNGSPSLYLDSLFGPQWERMYLDLLGLDVSEEKEGEMEGGDL